MIFEENYELDFSFYSCYDRSNPIGGAKKSRSVGTKGEYLL